MSISSRLQQGALRHRNAFIQGPVFPPETVAAKKGHLAGLSVAIKDNICTNDLPTTCGSRGLHGYQSPYDATVVARIRDAGGHISGKTNLDEFGMGSHSVHSAYGVVQSAAGRSAGGSSGGSAVAVATGQSDCALGTDTGGSVRLPAAYNDIYGFKPSYGMVSRWGVVAYANSLDTVGYMAKDVKTLRLLHRVLAGSNSYDGKDPTNLSSSSRQHISQLVAKRAKSRPVTFGVPQEYNTEELSPVVRQVWLDTLRRLQNAGHIVKPCSLPSTQQALSAYYVLAPAEASSNLAKYDSVRYGSGAPEDTLSTHEQLFTQTRHYGFGAEVRKRILLGAYSLSANAIDNYFMQAQRIRQLVSRDFEAVFSMEHPLIEQSENPQGLPKEDGVDAIICPTAPGLPPTFDQIARQSSLDAYSGDVFTVPASLAGLPAISVPVEPQDNKNLPDGIRSIGMQVITQFGNDDACLDYAELLGQV